MQNKIRAETAEDPELFALMKVVYNDWLSTVRELPSLIRPDWTYQLFIEDSLIFKGHRIVVPQAHREISYLNYLPAATKVQLRACTLVFCKEPE